MHQSCTLLYLSLLVPLLSPGFVFGRLIAKYIDDEYGDLETGEKPEFKGGRWIRGGVCEGCAPGVVPWHDNTRHTKDPIRSVAFNFTGISVEIFCILPNKHSDGVTVAYDISFVLDGQLVGHFTHSPDPKADFTYNKSVFSKDNLLPDTKHTMEVTLDSNTTDTVLLFDYAKYEIF
ncbi:hypothetical protein MPER_11108 [Moniliophthora perniciosa FA553]|nr:hypothetical protein MPER_11108 [Moniliophthora perniciosa FA553]